MTGDAKLGHQGMHGTTILTAVMEKRYEVYVALERIVSCTITPSGIDLPPGVTIKRVPLTGQSSPEFAEQMLGTAKLNWYRIEIDGWPAKRLQATRIRFNGTTVMFLRGSETIAYITVPCVVIRDYEYEYEYEYEAEQEREKLNDLSNAEN